MARFEEHLEDELGSLVAELAWNSYEPRDLFEVKIPKDDGTRILHIPAVRDRIVEPALLDVITPLIDPHLGPWSYAYRSGLGVSDAIAALVDVRDGGLPFVLRADVDDCFPSVRRDLALRLFGAIVEDPEVMGVVQKLLSRMTSRKGSSSRRGIRGLAQGCAMSPRLANLVLAGVDQEMVDSGFPLVRDADDMAVGAASVDEGWEAARLLGRALERWG